MTKVAPPSATGGYGDMEKRGRLLRCDRARYRRAPTFSPARSTLLEQARLAADAPPRALELLAAHAREFPRRAGGRPRGGADRGAGPPGVRGEAVESAALCAPGLLAPAARPCTPGPCRSTPRSRPRSSSRRSSLPRRPRLARRGGRLAGRRRRRHLPGPPARGSQKERGRCLFRSPSSILGRRPGRQPPGLCELADERPRRAARDPRPREDSCIEHCLCRRIGRHIIGPCARS